MGKNARKGALERFSVDRFVKDFEQLYLQLAGKSVQSKLAKER